MRSSNPDACRPVWVEIWLIDRASQVKLGQRVRGQLTQIGLGVLAADLVADDGDEDVAADAPEQILIGPPASWRMIWPLLSRISFWYRLVRFRSPPAACAPARLNHVNPDCLHGIYSVSQSVPFGLPALGATGVVDGARGPSSLPADRPGLATKT